MTREIKISCALIKIKLTAAEQKLSNIKAAEANSRLDGLLKLAAIKAKHFKTK